MAIEGASLTPIYNRLNSVGGYHPMNVDSFADWSVEAGDIVSVSRDGTAYASPVHSTRLVWRGSPEMQINATGKEKRDNIAKVSRRKYGRGGAGMRNNQGLYYEMFSEDGTVHSSLLMTASVLRTEFHDEISDVHSDIQQTASQIRSEVHAANSSIYSYVDQTATYIWDHVGHSSMTYAQMDDPTETPGAQMAEGDVWVQSPFVRTWDDAEDLTWDEMQELQWDQLKGATVWVWKDGEWKKAVDETELAKDTDLIRTNDYIKLFAKEQVAKNGQVDQYIADLTVTARQIRSDVSASRSELYSSIQQTATSILMTVNDTRNDLHSEIEQTASSIRSSVYASESMIYSSILETATSIRSEVGNALSDTYSTIEQTASSIRSSVWAEESQIYSFVKQTATYIWERVASKPRVFPQMTSPQGTAEEPLKDGDVWIYSPFIRTWDDAAEHTWDEMEQFQWDNLKGAQVFVRKDGKWQLAIDEITLAKETDLIKTDDYIKLFAKEQVGKNQKVDQYIADLTVTARQIRSDVSASRSELYSSIQQTATNILMTVNNVRNDLHSEIEQTASSIRSSVYADESQIYSSILETATSIRSEVGNALSDTYSTITQTASSIRSEVAAAESTIHSSIQQTASSIRSEVASSISGVNSTITQTADSIRSDVNAANSAIYSSIQQTASGIRSEVADSISDVRSEITQTASSWSAKISGVVDANGNVTAASIAIAINASTGESEAKIDAQRVYIGNDKSTTVIAGKATLNDVTADFISGRIANLSVLNVMAVSSAGNISISNGYMMAPYYYLGVAGNAVNMASSIHALRITRNGNTYTLQKQDYDDSDWVDVDSFSRATTLSGAWSGGRYTVTASPQGNTNSTELSKIDGNGAVSVSSSLAGYLNVPIKVQIDDDPEQGTYSTVYTGNPVIDIRGVLEEKTVTSNGDVTPSSGYVGLKKVTVNVSASHNIDIPSGQIYTTSGSPPSGSTKLTTMKTRIKEAIEDGDNLVFRVDCGGTQKYYYMEF